MVSHKAILVNGKQTNIPSYAVNIGDVVSVKENARDQQRIRDAATYSEQNGVANWVDVDFVALIGTFKNMPERSDLGSDINEQLVVELYSK
jgi:small subunit ribosomal protein S4